MKTFFDTFFKVTLFLCAIITLIVTFSTYFKNDNLMYDTNRKLDSLNNVYNLTLINVTNLNKKIDTLKNNVTRVDNTIEKIKEQKTIIREFYHEKINNINTITDAQIDSFFADRYKQK